MRSLLEYDDYKLYLLERCKAEALPHARLAEAAGLQRQYLPQVLRGKSNFSDEQAYLIGTFLGLVGDELSYFLLLVQEARVDRAKVRSYFSARRQSLRTQARLSGRLPAETKLVELGLGNAFDEFFLETDIQRAYAYFFIPRYQRDPGSIAQKLNASKARFEEITRKLMGMGLLERDEKSFRSKVRLLHLEKDSPISRQNHRNWRLHAAQLPAGAHEDAFFFSSTVSADARLRKDLMEKLKAVIAELHALLPDAKDEEVFQVNLDVFGV